MRVEHHTLTVQTRGKGTYDLTGELEKILGNSRIQNGTLTVFVTHTSASIVIYENADPTAREDLHRFFERLVPEDGSYRHSSEGPDDSTSHLRMALTRTGETVPVLDGRMALGTWQGLFLFEHRAGPHRRTVQVTIMGV
jgi:secondary thiamine-phosphate synthase enzyme